MACGRRLCEPPAAPPLQVDGDRVSFNKEAGLWTVASADGQTVVGRVLVSDARQLQVMFDGTDCYQPVGHRRCGLHHPPSVCHGPDLEIAVVNDTLTAPADLRGRRHQPAGHASGLLHRGATGRLQPRLRRGRQSQYRL